jgi:hypothetical protein
MPRKPSTPELTGRVLPFEPRRPRYRSYEPHHASIPPTSSAGSESEREQADPHRDDFRHRMTANAATLLVVILLILCGLWLADAIAQLRKTQDCVLSGRRNCSPIAIPDHER